MATYPPNTGDHTRATELPSDLPSSVRDVDLASCASDARHLYHLIDAALENAMQQLVPSSEEGRELNRATALLWTARDLGEILEWKLNRLGVAEEQRLRAEGVT